MKNLIHIILLATATLPLLAQPSSSATPIRAAELATPSPATAERPAENATDHPNPRTLLESHLDSLAHSDLKNALLAILVLDPQGDTLAAWNPHTLLVPASNMKLITTGLALNHLGPDFTFRSTLAYTGNITDGTLLGDLHIIGGADPTLASDDSIAVTLPQLFHDWGTIITDSGIKSIDGQIIGDDSFFDITMPEEQSWQWDDCGTYYGSGISGLTFFENIQSFSVKPGETLGAPVEIAEKFPHCPWMEYRFEGTTGEAGTGDKLYYFTSDLAPTGVMRGTFAIDRAPKTLDCSNKFPAYTCASYFADYLADTGITCTQGPADLGYFSHKAPAKAAKTKSTALAATTKTETTEHTTEPAKPLKILGSTPSPALARISAQTNRESNNLYAETLFHMLGKTLCGSADYDPSRKAATTLLTQMGLNPATVTIRDGSGLSRQNLLTPAFLCDFLTAMTTTPAFPDFVKGLPSPGDMGTMKNVMPKHDISIKSRIKLKSGSMTGVKCFSGYIFPENGGRPIVFSIMINNSLLPQYRLQKITDGILYRIATIPIP